MSSIRSIARISKTGVTRLGTVAILGGCVLLVAPSAASASTSGSPWESILQGIGKSVSTPFSVVYQLVETTKGVTTENESATFAQDPATKQVAFSTPQGAFYLSPTKTLACRSAAGHLECTSLPKSLMADMTSIEDLFAPGVIKTHITDLEAQASAHGYTLSSYSQSYGWTGPGVSGAQYPSNCVKVTGPKMNGAGVFCSSSSHGVLTFAEGSPSTTKTSTITIHAGSYVANPPASTFAPPPGTTIVTFP